MDGTLLAIAKMVEQNTAGHQRRAALIGLAIAEQHHERMDGSGYPHGLKNSEILPETRILAAADVFESMTSHRPALGQDAAIKELVANKGSLYHPDIVDAIVNLVLNKGYQIPE